LGVVLFWFVFLLILVDNKGEMGANEVAFSFPVRGWMEWINK
jgi:hypothetical protein